MPAKKPLHTTSITNESSSSHPVSHELKPSSTCDLFCSILLLLLLPSLHLPSQSALPIVNPLILPPSSPPPPSYNKKTQRKCSSSASLAPSQPANQPSPPSSAPHPTPSPSSTPTSSPAKSSRPAHRLTRKSCSISAPRRQTCCLTSLTRSQSLPRSL
jgi:hypothetical protein